MFQFPLIIAPKDAANTDKTWAIVDLKVIVKLNAEDEGTEEALEMDGDKIVTTKKFDFDTVLNEVSVSYKGYEKPAVLSDYKIDNLEKYKIEPEMTLKKVCEFIRYLNQQ